MARRQRSYRWPIPAGYCAFKDNSDEGLESGERAIELARQCGYPLVTAFATDIHCNVLTELRRPAACLELAEEQREIYPRAPVDLLGSRREP